MSPLVLFGLGALMTVVAVLLAAEHNRRTRRSRAMPLAAKRFAMAYSDVDRFNTTAVAFPLFREGDGRVVENLMWHEDGSPSPTRVFDYSYYSSQRRGRGLGLDLGFGMVTNTDVDTDAIASIGETRTWHAFSCALAQHNGAWPAIRIAKEGVVDKAFQMIGLPDIDFESEEFNRTFVVQCADRKFASALIDPLMMDFLLSTKGEITFETKGRFLLLSTRRVDPVEMPALLNLADEFVRRVPPAVRELYETLPRQRRHRRVPARWHRRERGEPPDHPTGRSRQLDGLGRPHGIAARSGRVVGPHSRRRPRPRRPRRPTHRRRPLARPPAG